MELLVRQRSRAAAPKRAEARATPKAFMPAVLFETFMPAVLFETFKCEPCGKAIFDVSGACRLNSCAHQVCR